MSADATDSVTPPLDTPGPQDVTPETAFTILGNARRRAVVEYLLEVESETTLDTLAERVAAAENGVDEQTLSSTQRKRVYTSLYQRHLPTLDEADVIEFDEARGRVELRPAAAPLVPYIRDDPDGGPPARSYLAVAVLTTAAVATAQVSPAVAGPETVLGLAPLLVVTLHCFVAD